MKLFTGILFIFACFMHFQRADGTPPISRGYVYVEMGDLSIFEGVFADFSTGDDIPEWMQPNGARHVQRVSGFIRTKEKEQSELRWLQFRHGPFNHTGGNVWRNGPTRAVLRLENDQWYKVIGFDMYVPQCKHRPPQRPCFPPINHFYIVVPGGEVYRGLLQKVNSPERRLGLTSHSIPRPPSGRSNLGADGWPRMTRGYVSVEMDDTSIYDGFFTGFCTGADIPEWMQPNGVHNAEHVLGFIRTLECKQSETSWLQFRNGPANHNFRQHGPARSVIRFGNDEWYKVTRFQMYIPNAEHRPPATHRMFFPLQGHIYVVIPGGNVYRGLLEEINAPEKRLGLTSHSTPRASSRT